MHAHDTPTNDRRDRLGAILVAGVVGLALVAVMITRTSQAVFTASVDNSGNSFESGTVTLGDNDSDAALFTLPAMDPGEPYTSCIRVEYTGSITAPSSVNLYASGVRTGSTTLGNHIVLTVETGTSDPLTPFGDCSTFASGATPLPAKSLNAFYTDHTDYTTGVDTWTPTGTPETLTYRFTAELLDSVPDSEEGATVGAVTFVWEIES